MKMHSTFFLENSEEILAFTSMTHSCGLKPVAFCTDVLYKKISNLILVCRSAIISWIINKNSICKLQMKDGRRYALSFEYFNPYELHGATKLSYETQLQQEPSLPRLIESHVNILQAKWSWTIKKYLFLRLEIGKECTISIWKLFCECS